MNAKKLDGREAFENFLILDKTKTERCQQKNII